MVRSSGIREKLRSNVLKELARDRGVKRSRDEVVRDDQSDEDESEEQIRLKNERRLAHKNHSLLTILPPPKNSSAFGPTVKLDKLLKMPTRGDETYEPEIKETSDRAEGDDAILEVDVSKLVNDNSHNLIKSLTVEQAQPTVIVPKGKEKQKNQITYLAQLGKANELERKEQAAQSRINKSAARSKYGW